MIFAAEKDGQFIGYVIFHEYDIDSYELGWVLAKKYWGKDMITKSAEMKKDLIIECVFEQEKTKHLALSNGFTYTDNFNNLDAFRLKAQR